MMLHRWLAPLLVLLLGSSATLAQPLVSPAPMLADAELTSVCFVDADHGWAVGDRGVILATSDGGRNWQLQRSPTACRLECVQFLDTLNGWAAGGFTRPYTHHTSGIVLRTRDGGRTWQATADQTLPTIKLVKFSDVRRGWAVGDASPLYSSGVFRTEDGGREWTPVPKGSSLGWTAADFRDDQGGSLAGHGGRTAVTNPSQVRPSRTANLGAAALRRLVLAGQSAGWLVGDEGQVLTTSDSGFTWKTPPGALPSGAADFDYYAAAAYGSHCWIAGNPGSCVYHSADGGQSWETLRTEQRLPIRALTFLDENRGWGVGSLGLILATRDGGRSWRVQRSGGTRTPLLGIFADPARVPLEVFAQQSASEGYLGALEIFGRAGDGQSDPRHMSLPDRTHEGFVAAGGSHASSWRMPLPPAGLALTPQAVMDFWNAASDGKATAILEEHLVRRIRTWRPEVVVTENVTSRGEDPLAHVTSQIVLAAVKQAADPAAFADQISDQGLEPWKVKKVFGIHSASRQGTVNVVPSQWSPRLARSLADVAESGRSLLVTSPQPAPTTLGLSLLVDHLPQNTGRRDVFSGIMLLAGGEGRRQTIEPPSGDLELLARAAQKRHNVAQLLARVSEDPSQGAAMLAQIDELTAGIGDRGTGEILLALAQRYQQAGRPQAAAETLERLLTRYPQHPLSDTAALWLVQYYSSGEMAWRLRSQSQTVVHTAGAVNGTGREPFAGVQAAGEANTKHETRNAKHETALSERAGRALAAGKLIERTRPVLFADPRFRFPLVSAYAAQGQEKLAEQFFASLAANATFDPWGSCAVAEQCLRQKQGTPPKTVISCVTAAARPRLDGRLDDELWKTARPVALTSSKQDDALWPADAVLAYDDEFLYIAISARKSAGGDYTADESPRAHDADLTSRDRVEIHLDIDRDYTSYWTLAVDCRGFTRDRVFGDATWNPTWYVARGGDEQFWTAEIAIPLSQLAPQPPKARDTWAIGIQRIVPNVGFQSATQPASMDVRPEGFGLLGFE
ncbi:MAG TPA: YCF48-related protein, partial [Pirellulaceae bacterium]|nr:YCF48-related protein [Pirellulaceae bacterium]